MTENGTPETASEWFEFGSEFRSATPDQQGLYLESLIDEIARLRARPPALICPPDPSQEHLIVQRNQYEILKADAEKFRLMEMAEGTRSSFAPILFCRAERDNARAECEELRTDAELGALVRQLPRSLWLYHTENDNQDSLWAVIGEDCYRTPYEKTPEGAIRTALKDKLNADGV